MLAPLLSILLAAAPASADGTVPAPKSGPLFAHLFGGWSMGYTGSLGGTAGAGGLHGCASLGVASTMFEEGDIQSHLALALGLQWVDEPEWELRVAVGGRPLSAGPFTLGVVSSAALRWTNGVGATARVGPELSAHVRLGGSRHVLQPFVRYEWALVDRARFEDRATLGLQFLFAD